MKTLFTLDELNIAIDICKVCDHCEVKSYMYCTKHHTDSIVFKRVRCEKIREAIKDENDGKTV